MRLLVAITLLLSPGLLFAQTTKPTTAPSKPPPSLPPGVTYPLNLEKEGLYVPRLKDTHIDSILKSSNTIYYKLPALYQFYIPASNIEHRNVTLGTTSWTVQKMLYSIYSVDTLKEFNANADFPWEGTVGLNGAARAGLHDTRYGAFNVLSLPEENGRVIPILVLNETPIKWIYPVGTIVGEILWMKDDKGVKWVYEVRLRQKDKGSDAWEPMIFRPIKNRMEMLSLLNLPADWKPGRKHMHFRNPEEDMVFEMDGLVERLPNLAETDVKFLLRRTFQDVTYETWGDGGNNAPCSDTEFNLFPKDYNLGLIQVDQESCASCHKQTQISVRNLIPKEPLVIKNPSKIGNIRGCDGVFTWHPFDYRSVSTLDKPNSTTYVRDYDRDNGIIKIFKEGDYVKNDLYKLTRYVQDALQHYELPKAAQFCHEDKQKPEAMPKLTSSRGER